MDRFLDLLVRYRVAGGFLLAVSYLWLARPSVWSLAAGLAVALAGLGVRAWATGHIRKGERLTTTGPYSLVRNPLYLGSFLVGLGVLVMGQRWLLGALCLPLFLLVYGRKIGKEERHLTKLYGEEYEEYLRKVPRIIPRLAPVKRGEGFAWRLLVRNREYRLWLGLAGVTAFLAVKASLGG